MLSLSAKMLKNVKTFLKMLKKAETPFPVLKAYPAYLNKVLTLKIARNN